VSFYKPDSDAERVKALEAEVLRLKAELEDWKDGASIEAQRADEMQEQLRVARDALERIASVEIEDSPQPLYAVAAAHAECIFLARDALGRLKE
jgi:phage tail sheath gpL-like